MTRHDIAIERAERERVRRVRPYARRLNGSQPSSGLPGCACPGMLVARSDRKPRRRHSVPGGHRVPHGYMMQAARPTFASSICQNCVGFERRRSPLLPASPGSGFEGILRCLGAVAGVQRTNAHSISMRSWRSFSAIASSSALTIPALHTAAATTARQRGSARCMQPPRTRSASESSRQRSDDGPSRCSARFTHSGSP